MPLSSLAEQNFEDTVLRALERLERITVPRPAEVDLAALAIAVDDLPPPSMLADETFEQMPLGQFLVGPPPRVVIFRRPVELRSANAGELTSLVRAVLTELIADLFGLPPEAIDPDYA